ncbi:MAG TPA: M28 family peptidase [Solirubrobacteraceae bacterium]|nr:M28 family peptidase [Solirubrobacteraceae bacterium]
MEVLHEVVERLAPMRRRACTDGEREAADWLAERFRRVPGVEVSVEDEPSWGTFPPTATGLGVLGLTAGALALGRRRGAAALLAAATIAGVVDEAQNGPRVLRRLIRRRRTTQNVLARVPAEGASAGTLVVLAHHDAPQTGLIFDQTMQQKVYARKPELIEAHKTPPPQWWLGLAGPVLTLATALTGRRTPARVGLAIGSVATFFIADMWRSETVQGANDNLSGVASLVALAEQLAAEPVPGLEVLLVSCGAEETLQDGIRAFMASHGQELDRERTWFVNLDTVGSAKLVLLEAEGPVWMEEYAGPWIRDLVEDSAERVGVPFERGYRARASTDSIIPSRAGYPIATIVSLQPWRSPANYHLASDTPEKLDYDTVAGAVRLVAEVARSLAARTPA